MAIDTATRRSSALLVGLPFRVSLAPPDGADSDGDRAQAAYLYHGLDYAADGGGGAAPADWYITAMRRGQR